MPPSAQARDKQGPSRGADGADWFRRVPEIRNLADIARMEEEPLERQIANWDANDWMRLGCCRFPDKPALLYISDGDVAATPTVLTYGELSDSANRFANLFNACGARATDPVLILVPTIPVLYPI